MWKFLPIRISFQWWNANKSCHKTGDWILSTLRWISSTAIPTHPLNSRLRNRVAREEEVKFNYGSTMVTRQLESSDFLLIDVRFIFNEIEMNPKRILVESFTRKKWKSSHCQSSEFVLIFLLRHCGIAEGSWTEWNSTRIDSKEHCALNKGLALVVRKARYAISNLYAHHLVTNSVDPFSLVIFITAYLPPTNIRLIKIFSTFG